MFKWLMTFVLLVISPSTSLADLRQECTRGVRDPEGAISACTKLIVSQGLDKQSLAVVYVWRSVSYSAMGNYKAALNDNEKAISLAPNSFFPYMGRCALYSHRGEYEKAMADCNEVISLAPQSSYGFGGRAYIYAVQMEYDLALQNIMRAAKLANSNELPDILTIRGYIYLKQGNLSAAKTDLDRAINLGALGADAYFERGIVLGELGQYKEALADFDQGFRQQWRPVATAYSRRAEIYVKLGNVDLAVADARKALTIPAFIRFEQDEQIRAAELLTKLTGEGLSGGSQPDAHRPPKNSSSELRIALVIGNSNYSAVGALRNPSNDAKIIGDTLSRIGFSVQRYNDLGLSDMGKVLREFGDRAASADWAVIYFAGHGLEMNGVAYVIPTDAMLERDSHVQEETVSLERLLDKVQGARTMKLVILDACRNNPFVARMARSGGAARSFGRGLPALEPEGDILVAYATRHGTVASDGEGLNGPYAQALVQHLPAPGIDVRVMFGRVRDTVRTLTKNAQEPFVYGSIGGDLRYFANN